MPQDVRLWSICDGDELVAITPAKLDLEARVEAWLEQDISMVSDNLLVVGRQVETDFGGAIDLLCLDANGDLVILELKRDKTPREITAQVLDYASWVKDLSNEQITEMADSYLGEKGPLDQAFENRFGAELPEILNEHHQMLIVASEIDSSSERIVRYLSDSYGVSMNAVTFHYFRDNQGRELVARVFLIEPSAVERQTRDRVSSKRRRNLSYEELQEISDGRGVGEIYRELVDGLRQVFDRTSTTQSSIAFIGRMGDSYNTIFSLVPGESNQEDGVCFQVFVERLSAYLRLDESDATPLLPDNRQEWERAWARGYAGYFQDLEGAREFVRSLREVKQAVTQ